MLEDPPFIARIDNFCSCFSTAPELRRHVSMASGIGVWQVRFGLPPMLLGVAWRLLRRRSLRACSIADIGAHSPGLRDIPARFFSIDALAKSMPSPTDGS